MNQYNIGHLIPTRVTPKIRNMLLKVEVVRALEWAECEYLIDDFFAEEINDLYTLSLMSEGDLEEFGLKSETIAVLKLYVEQRPLVARD